MPGRDGRLAIELRQQHFADGIGWFDQRSMQVDPAQLRQIQAVLGSGNLPVPDGLEEPRAIIPFPGPSSSVPQRPAMGE